MGIANITNNILTDSGVATSTLVPTTRTLTINGVAFDLSADRSWTIAAGSGTVTSVAALTLGTTGTDLSSTVATGTTTPVITLNVPTASAANRGALSAADWTTFNSKQDALGGTGFVKSTAGTISYDTSVYLTTASAASTYAPLTGTGASGTWGINITGNAATATSATDSTKLPLAGGTMTGNITYSNGRKGIVGLYNPAQTQAIFAMGPAYVLTDGGGSSTIGDFYGLGWSYNPDYGGAGNNPQSKAGLDHQLLLMNAGVTLTALGRGIWTIGNVTAASATFSGNVAASGGASGGFLSSTYASGYNRIWAFGNSPNYGLGYYQGGTDYIGFHFGATASPQITFNQSGVVTATTFSGTLTGTASGNVVARGQSNWNDSTVIGNVVGMLAWKNYGNGHVIFDASQATSPSGTAVSQTNSQIAWTAAYPTLMGWNGTYTYGVRVDSARIADSASSATFATSSSRLYSTDAAYNYNSANPYYGYLTYDGTYWLFKVSPASPDRVRVYRSDTSALADNASSISSATGNNYNWTGLNYFVSNRNTSTDSAPLQAYSNNGSGAIMSFHRGGYYAVNFGLDSDNVMRIGGWSAGVNRWQLDMSGNMSTAGSYTSGGLIRVGASTNLYLDTNYGCSVVGVYASTRFQGVFAMGDAYKLAIDGTSPGNLYGISWSHPNAGGQATYLNDHGMMVMVNGVTYSALSSNIWARGRVTANEDVYSNSGWFYSNNNAGWYNNTYGQGIRPAKANLTYGSIVNIGENFNGYGGYGITNTYNTLYMQNSGGDHGFFRDGGGGGWSFFYHQNYNCAGIGTDATDPSYSLHIIKYGGSNTGWIIWSDRRIKENIKTIDNALDKVLSLRGVYYNKIDDPNKERCVGYIAQEVMEVVPELVVYSEELDIYNMNYGPMVAMLTEAIKEQQAQIEELKQQVQLLLNR
jgi:hypothetical protein